MNEEMNEMHRDPELRAALRLIETDPPLAEVDWDSLRSSIVARAELPLARRRSHSARLSRLTRSLIPLAAAASIALTVWITNPTVRSSTTPVADNTPDVALPAVTPEDIFQAEMSDQEFMNAVSAGGVNAADLLAYAVDES